MNRKEFYNGLSDDVKRNIKACKTEEEMMKVLSDEMIELDPDLLEKVSGGLLLMDCTYVCDKYESKSDC